MDLPAQAEIVVGIAGYSIAADRADRQKHLVDGRDQRRPQAVRRIMPGRLECRRLRRW